MLRLFFTIILLISPLAETLFTHAAWAVSPQEEQNRKRCISSDPAVSIGGCTAVTQSSEESKEMLATAFNNRCWARAVISHLQDAVADCDQAILLFPENARYFDSRGFAYLKMGQYVPAIADYDTALKLNAKIASSLYGRSLAERAQGDVERADRDIAAAKEMQTDIEQEFIKIGVSGR